MTEDQIKASPWYAWLERRFSGEVAARIITETSKHALAQDAIEGEEKHREHTGL